MFGAEHSFVKQRCWYIRASFRMSPAALFTYESQNIPVCSCKITWWTDQISSPEFTRTNKRWEGSKRKAFADL